MARTVPGRFRWQGRAARCGRGRCRSARATADTGDVRQRERRRQRGQAEVFPGGAGDRVGDGDDQVGVEGQLQREGGGGPGGHDASFEAACGQGVVDRVAQASAPRNGEVLGGCVALEAQRAFGERVVRPDGDDQPVPADEAMADVGERRSAGARFEVDLTPAQLGVVRPGFGGQAQPDAGRPMVDGGDQGGAAGRGQGIVPAHGEHPVQSRQVEFLLRGQQVVGLLHEGVDLGAHGQRPGGGGPCCGRCGPGSGHRWPCGCGPGSGSSPVR